VGSLKGHAVVLNAPYSILHLHVVRQRQAASAQMMCLKSRARSFLNAPSLLHDKISQNSAGTRLNRRDFRPGFWFRRFLSNGSAYLYTLETDTVPVFPGPGAASSGKVVWVDDDGMLTTIASGLVFPTAMTFAPDGALFISNFGLGVPPIGLGQIVRVQIGD